MLSVRAIAKVLAQTLTSPKRVPGINTRGKPQVGASLSPYYSESLVVAVHD